ncbi:MAG: trigger factor [Parcubacteria group bacterium]
MDIKKLPKSQIEFEVSIAPADWEKYLDVAAAEASEEIKIAGFRPGKAPRNLVEQKIGKAAIFNVAAEKAVKASYIDIITKEKLDVIGSPKIEVLEGEEGKELKYKAIAAVMPKVEVKESYVKGIKKINEEFKNKTPKVADEELELELEKLANSRVQLVTVMREARKNDNVEIDFQVLVGGVPIENGTSKKHNLIIGRGVFIPGFEEQVIGMREGDEKEFELSFPESYHKKDLAGKPAAFKVKMNLVQERKTPELTDEFAAGLGKFKDLEDLKRNMREGMEHENEHKIKEERRASYLDEIIKHTKSDLPEILLTEEVRKMEDEMEHQLSSMGMNLDQYLEQLKKTKAELRKDWEPQAVKRVMSALVLKEAAQMQDIVADTTEVEAEMNKTLQYYKGVKDMEKNIDMERLYTYSKGILENEKVFEYLEKL